MSYQVECDECGQSCDIRGYAGHLRMAHGINGSEMRDLVEKKKRYIAPSDSPAGGQQSEASTDGGVDHAAQVQQDAGTHQQNAEHDTLSACTMCGRNGDVQRADDVARLFQQRGHSVPAELHEYDFYCADCQYAFDGGETL